MLDEVRALEYRRLAEPSIARYDGRYVTQAAVPEAVEGTWPASRVMTIVEFPSLERARQWYSSLEYARARAAREGAIDLRLLFTEGRLAEPMPA
nr:DUF1330 domain-containing protein [Streptoalloteichus tenebrarius]